METNAEPLGEELAVATARAFAEYHGHDVDAYEVGSEPTDDGWDVSFAPASERKADPGDFFNVIVSSADARIVFGK